MRGECPVARSRGPSVRIRFHVLKYPVRSHALQARLQLRPDLAQHRLDRQDHSLAQRDSASALAEVVDLRLLVHLPSDAVTDEGADDVEPARLGVLLN